MRCPCRSWSVLQKIWMNFSKSTSCWWWWPMKGDATFRLYIYPNFQSLHIVQLTYIKVEGIKTNIYNRLPIANTLLSYIVPHDVGVSRPTEWRFRCQSYSVSICLLKFVMPIFERLNHFKAIQEDHNKFMIWNYLESWDSLQHQLQCINQKNKECLGIEIYVVIEYLHN